MSLFDSISGGDLDLLGLIGKWADTIDGYAYVGGSLEEAEKLAEHVRSRWLESSFFLFDQDTLKAALFIEYRMLRFAGHIPSQRHFTYLLALDAAANGADGAAGPWTGLAKVDGRWFCPEDLPHIEAFNALEVRSRNPTSST